jgi:hypothetical protein
MRRETGIHNRGARICSGAGGYGLQLSLRSAGITAQPRLGASSRYSAPIRTLIAVSALTLRFGAALRLNRDRSTLPNRYFRCLA